MNNSLETAASITALSIEERVFQIVADQADQPRERVSRDTSLHEIFDSLDQVEVTMALEDEFELAIADAEAERVLTVGQMVDLIESKLTARRPPDGDAPPSS